MNVDYTSLSDGALKELYEKMKARRESVANNPTEEEVYETQKPDWQDEFAAIEKEMIRRGLISPGGKGDAASH